MWQVTLSANFLRAVLQLIRRDNCELSWHFDILTFDKMLKSHPEEPIWFGFSFCVYWMNIALLTLTPSSSPRTGDKAGPLPRCHWLVWDVHSAAGIVNLNCNSLTSNSWKSAEKSHNCWARLNSLTATMFYVTETGCQGLWHFLVPYERREGLIY